MKRRTVIFTSLIAVALIAAAVAVARRGPKGTAVDVGTAARQARFRSAVTASGEVVASQYADGSKPFVTTRAHLISAGAAPRAARRPAGKARRPRISGNI